MLLTLLIFTIINVCLAFIDAHKIIKGKWIKHGVNGAVYLAMLIVPYLLFHNLWFIAALLFNRLLVFNIMLSLFRGLKWYYMPITPLSITDKLAKKVFGINGKLAYSVYAIIFIALVVIEKLL